MIFRKTDFVFFVNALLQFRAGIAFFLRGAYNTVKQRGCRMCGGGEWIYEE